MVQNFLKIDQLSDQARKNAVKDFINFYLKHFKAGNLDVIVNQDHDEVVTSINEYILINRNFHHDTLVARLFDNRFSEFYTLLTEVDQGYSEDGTALQQSWTQWLATLESQIDTKEALS